MKSIDKARRPKRALKEAALFVSMCLAPHRTRGFWRRAWNFELVRKCSVAADLRRPKTNKGFLPFRSSTLAMLGNQNGFAHLVLAMGQAVARPSFRVSGSPRKHRTILSLTGLDKIQNASARVGRRSGLHQWSGQAHLLTFAMALTATNGFVAIWGRLM